MRSDVTLVQLPWARPRRSPVQLGLVAALLRAGGVASRHVAGNVALARAIGPEPYALVCERMPRFFGEWVFARALFGDGGPSGVPDMLDRVSRTLAGSPLFTAADEARLRRLVDEEIPAFVAALAADVCDAPGGPPAVLGMSCTHDQLLAALAVGRAVTERAPGCRVVLGGAQVWGDAGAAVLDAFPWVHWVVDGEADTVALPLFRALCDGERPPVPHDPWPDGRGLVRAALAPEPDLDTLPPPEVDGWLAARPEQVAGPLAIQVELSRGCDWARGKGPCGFCGLCPAARGHRSKSASRITAELTTLAAGSWLLDFEATDTQLPPRAARALRTLRGELDVKLFAEVRTRDYVRHPGLLRAAGVHDVQAGVEALDDVLLAHLRKGATLADNVAFLRAAARDGIRVRYNLLHGIPGETAAEYERTLSLAPLLHHLAPPIQLLGVVLMRDSPYFEERDRHGFTDVRPARGYAELFPPGRVDLDRLAYLFEGALRGAVADAVLNRLHHALLRWYEAVIRGARLAMRRGPGFLRIEDSRDPERPRGMALTGLPARVLLTSDVPARTAALAAALGEEEAAVRAAGDELVRLELALWSDDRLVVLPVPAEAPPLALPARPPARVLDGWERAPY